MKTTTVVLRLASGIYQITLLQVQETMDGVAKLPLSIKAPVYNEDRFCDAVFYKKNRRGKWFYKEE